MASGSESRSHSAPHKAWREPVVALRQRVRRAMAPTVRRLLDRLDALKAILLSRVPERFHAITDEIAKFGTIGLINLGVNVAVFNALLVVVAGSEVKAKAMATIVAATSAYFLNRYWTYRHRPKTTLRREYSLFFLFNAVGLMIETAIVALAKYGFDQTSWLVLNVCTFLGIALGTVFRFWAYRTHVFKKAPATAASAPPVLAAGVPAVVADVHRSAAPAAADAATADPDGDVSEFDDVTLVGAASPDNVVDPVVDPADVVDSDGVADPARVMGPASVMDPSGVVDPDGVADPARVMDPDGVADPARVMDPSGVVDPDGIADPASVMDPSGVVVGQTDVVDPVRDTLADELVDLELDQLLRADNPVRR